MFMHNFFNAGLNILKIYLINSTQQIRFNLLSITYFYFSSFKILPGGRLRRRDICL